jgi:DnaJ-class molecular chaperone
MAIWITLILLMVWRVMNVRRPVKCPSCKGRKRLFTKVVVIDGHQFPQWYKCGRCGGEGKI